MTITVREPACSPTLEHEAMFYADRDQFLAGIVPFLREGLAAGEPALVALVPPKIALVRAALGSDADEVTFVDMIGLGGNPARIIPAWRAFTAAHDGRAARLRGIGELIWAARRPVEILEAQLHEQLLNVAFEPGPSLLLRCPYDTAALPAAVIAEARRSHPVLAADGTARHSTDFDGSKHAVAAFESDLPGAPLTAHHLDFSGDAGLAAARQIVGSHASDAGLDPHRAADLRLAISELVANSVAYGGGGSLALWCEDRRFVCEVRDGGRIHDVLAGRVEPGSDWITGRGLWLVNQICELVQLRSSAAGTVIRVHTSINA